MVVVIGRGAVLDSGIYQSCLALHLVLRAMVDTLGAYWEAHRHFGRTCVFKASTGFSLTQFQNFCFLQFFFHNVNVSILN